MDQIILPKLLNQLRPVRAVKFRERFLPTQH